MLNKPKYMTPSTNVSECTVDVNADSVVFSCIVDGNEAVYAWRIKIYKLSDGEIVYDTGKITSKNNSSKLPSLPFYPVNAKNQNVVFSVNLKNYSSISDVTNSFTNSADAYYWVIEFWNNSDNKNDTSGKLPTVISCEEAFYANTTPDVELLYKIRESGEYVSFPVGSYETPVFSSANYYFKATYSQDEEVGLKRYGWRIKDTKTGRVLLDTISDNQIYGIADNIVCQYSGFETGNNYSVELYIETQNNIELLSEAYVFSVSYPTTFLTADFVTENLAEESAIINSWGDSNVVEGHSTSENISYVENYPIIESEISSVRIEKNESIVYNYNGTSNLDVSEDSYIVLSTQLLDNSNTVIFSAEGNDVYGNSIVRKLCFINGKFEYIISDTTGGTLVYYYTITTTPYFVGRYKWFIIIMKPCNADGDLLVVNEFYASGGVYPSTSLYPSETLYPSFGGWKLIDNKEAS